MKMIGATSINRINFLSLQGLTGTYTYCAIAVLSPCDCNTTSYKDIKMHADFKNPTSLLLDGRTSITVD